MWRLNNLLLNNQWVSEENQRGYQKNTQRQNANTMVQNLSDAVKVVLRGKFIAIQIYCKKQKKNLKQSKLTPKGT